MAPDGASTPAEPTQPEPTREGARTPAARSFSVAPASTEVTGADLALVEGFVAFSLGSTDAAVSQLHLSPAGVHLGLGDEVLAYLPVATAADPAAWVIDEDVFRAYVGPFSALDVLSRGVTDTQGDDDSLATQKGELVVTVGEHPHCVSPAVPPPPAVEGMRRVSVQPAEGAMGSCIDWFTVDFFVHDDGAVAAITLDLWEP